MKFLDIDIYENEIGIYKILNLVTGIVYIGQTRDSFKSRYVNHLRKLITGKHANYKLQNAWNEYGEDSFEFSVVEVLVDDYELINEKECGYIDMYAESSGVYNIIKGGGASHHKYPLSPLLELGELNRKRLIGSKLPEDTKKKMSDARKGRHISRECEVITPDQAIIVKKMLMSGMNPSQISREYDIPYKAINNILSSNTWSSFHVEGWDEWRLNRKTWSRLNKQDHEEIYRLHEDDGLTKYEIADMYNKSVKMIEKIFRDQRKLHDNPVPST